MHTLKRILKWAGVSLAVVVVLAGALLAHTWYFKPLSINWFFNRVMIEYAVTDPQLLTQLGFLENLGIRRHNAQLTDASPERDRWVMDKLRRDLETLRSYDRDSLEGQTQLSYDILESFLATLVDGEKWRFHTYPMNQMFGVQNGLPNFMITVHKVEDRVGAEHYISRLNQFQRRLGQALDGVKRREQLGVIPPTFVVERVLNEMRGFAGVPARENVLFTSFDEKLAGLVAIDEISAEQRDELAMRAEAAINDSVYPIYNEMIAYYESVLPKTAGNHGVWALPDGAEFYDYAIRLMTSTTLPADEIHQIGLAEVERIGAEMDAILRNAGYTDGTLGARIWQLKEDPAQFYEDSPAGRAQIIADYQTIIDEISDGLDPYFDVRPKAGMRVERVPEFREEGSALAYYQAPSLDGSRPGVFYINLRNMGDLPRFGMRTLAYHEGVPGHHFQIGITMELEGLPIFRRLLPSIAYSEGWALYTERLAWEIGFQDDPLDNLGRLQAEMFRAVRLVVDTGLHSKRWTRERAIEYMIAHTGYGETEVVAEIERYLVMPGQALAYKLGMNKILELRAHAQERLGDAFDISEFHNVVLTNGALPLDILERVVDDWIASKSD
ncbi:MAG: DUF885 domain-containing protein [Xanthomonadaceae bacterium]|nr:DUF885 domain-containing protein [Xanthomonadaceae bacterium]